MTEPNHSQEPYRILMAVGEEAHLQVLLAVAVPLARAWHGRVTALYVGPRDVLETWFRIPSDMRDVVDEPVVIEETNVSQAILHYARQHRPNLLIVHWKGRPSRGRYLLGRTLDPLIQYAPFDVAVVRVNEPPEAFAERMAHQPRILVPASGGPNASLALQIALGLSDLAVTALRVAPSHLGSTAVSAQREILHTHLGPYAAEKRLYPKVVLARSIARGIHHEAADHDLVIIGATRESFVDRLLFGNLPQDLASTLPKPLIIVRRHDPAAVALLRQARWRIVTALSQLTEEERIAVYRQVRRGARTSTDFYVMAAISFSLAALGLLLNSATVIIGAMVVGPLMSALLGIGMGVVQGDPWLLRVALRTLVLGIVTGVVVSGVMGLIIPQHTLTNEMLSRCSPTLLDLAVAAVAGAAAAYAAAHKAIASDLIGIAIAVAIEPSLATFGLASVMGYPHQALGALLMFATNLIAIISAVVLMLIWMGFHPSLGERTHARTFHRGILGVVALLVCVGLILGLLTASTIRTNTLRQEVRTILEEEVPTLGEGARLVDWEITRTDGPTLHLAISVEAPGEMGAERLAALQERLTRRLKRPIALSITTLPVIRLSPVQAPSAIPRTP